MYKSEYLYNVLKEIGFKEVSFMSDWNSKPQDKLENIYGEYIIIAKK